VRLEMRERRALLEAGRVEWVRGLVEDAANVVGRERDRLNTTGHAENDRPVAVPVAQAREAANGSRVEVQSCRERDDVRSSHDRAFRDRRQQHVEQDAGRLRHARRPHVWILDRNEGRAGAEFAPSHAEFRPAPDGARSARCARPTRSRI
jgi:hypothetical protein